MGLVPQTFSEEMQKFVLLSLVSTSLLSLVTADGYGDKGGGSGSGSACIVKGSYCSCHYCKCEKGQISCKGGHHGGGGYGKKYCYGGMEGEYCHCDYCNCKHGFGQEGYGGCGGGH